MTKRGSLHWGFQLNGWDNLDQRLADICRLILRESFYVPLRTPSSLPKSLLPDTLVTATDSNVPRHSSGSKMLSLPFPDLNCNLKLPSRLPLNGRVCFAPCSLTTAEAWQCTQCWPMATVRGQNIGLWMMSVSLAARNTFVALGPSHMFKPERNACTPICLVFHPLLMRKLVSWILKTELKRKSWRNKVGGLLRRFSLHCKSRALAFRHQARKMRMRCCVNGMIALITVQEDLNTWRAPTSRPRIWHAAVRRMIRFLHSLATPVEAIARALLAPFRMGGFPDFVPRCLWRPEFSCIYSVATDGKMTCNSNLSRCLWKGRWFIACL